MWIDSNGRCFDTFQTDSSQQQSPAASVKVSLTISERGNLWILHDKPLPVILNWAYYDADSHSLSLVAQDGQIFGLGMRIDGVLEQAVAAAHEIYLVYKVGDEIRDMSVLPLVPRRYSSK